MLKIQNLEINFGKTKLIQNFNVEMKKGEILTIVGKNGSGKTSILKAILNILPKRYFQGNISYNGSIGYFSQNNLETPTNFNTTIEEILNYSKINKENLDFSKYFSDESLKKKYTDLSGGEKQKISLVRLKINNYDTLLFDEPTNAADLELKKEILDFIMESSKEGKIIIIVTHDYYLLKKLKSSAIEISDKIIKYKNLSEYVGKYDI